MINVTIISYQIPYGQVNIHKSAPHYKNCNDDNVYQFVQLTYTTVSVLLSQALAFPVPIRVWSVK